MVICDTSMISANVGVLLKGDIFKLVLNILTYHLIIKTPQWLLKIEAYSKFPIFTKNYLEHSK